MLNFNSILLFSKNPKILVEFYKKVFGADPVWSEEDFVGFQVGSGMFTVGPHDKVHGKNPNPERALFNFETNDVAGEFRRVKDLGAHVVQEPYQPSESPDMWVATFNDPDNNYFQLMSPMKM